MKRLPILVLALAISIGMFGAACADTDFSAMSLDELIEVQRQLTAAMWASEDWESVTVPVGVYEVGVDIPAGRWTISGTDNKSGIVYWGESLDTFGVEVESKIADFTHWNDEGINWNLVEGTYISVTISPVVFTPYVPVSLGFGARKQAKDEEPSENDLQVQNEQLKARVCELEAQNETLQRQLESFQSQPDDKEDEVGPDLSEEATPELSETTEVTRDLKFTDRGDDVTRLNQRLSELGFLSGQVFTYYGSATRDAVERFQESVGLPVTGIADKKTQKALFEMAVTAPPTPTPTPYPMFTPIPVTKPTLFQTYATLLKGSKGDEVKKLQARLKELGYLSGNADGEYGNMTQSAVSAFQAAAGLSQTGIADGNTQKALYAISAPRAKVYAKLDYTAVARDPNAHKGELITFQGKILQVMEYGNSVVFRISSKGSYDNVMYCTYTAPDNYSRFLEDDRVTVYGECTGVYTYETVMGASVTIPSCKIDRIELR